MLNYKLIEGHWKDDPDKEKHIRIVVETGEEVEITDKDGNVTKEFEERLATELKLKDDDVFYYQEKWNPEDICDGDFIVDEILADWQQML